MKYKVGEKTLSLNYTESIFLFPFFPFLSFSKGYKIKRLYRLSTVVSIAYIFMGERISFLIRDATFGPYKQYGITGSHLIEIDESK